MKLIDYDGTNLEALTEKFWEATWDVEIEYLSRVAELNDIEYADWSTEIPEDWNKIAFVGPYKLEGGQGDWSGISLFNPTWLDIWKACDKSIMALGLITVVDDDGDEFETPPCDHIFIEEITAENGVISIHFGS
jgi:hypothetical protein